MSEQEFEAYLRLMGRFLRLDERQRQAIGRELRAHMEDRLDDLLARGHAREEAINLILDEFGDAANLASDFGRIGMRRKWIMRTTAGTIGIAAAILFVSFLLPENRPLPSPTYSTAAMGEAAGPDGPEPAGSAPVFRASGPGPGTVSIESEADREARRKLATVIKQVQFPPGTALEEVLTFLEQNGGMSISVNWNALSGCGLDRTADVQGVNLTNVRLETALEVVLQNVQGPDSDIGYVILDGNIRISTGRDLTGRTVVRVYDCQDLMGRPTSGEIRDAIRSALADIGLGAGGSGLGGSSPPCVADAIRNLERARANELSMLITSTISPESWKNGSNSISEYDNLLVVVADLQTQQKLIDLLGMLRQARAARETRETAPCSGITQATTGGAGLTGAAPFNPRTVAARTVSGDAAPASRPADVRR